MKILLRGVLKTILDGLYDDDCPLSKLRGCPHIMKVIWTDVNSFWSNAILFPFERSEDAEDDFNSVLSGDRRRSRVSPFVCSRENQDSFHSWLYFARIHLSQSLNSGRMFPEPSNININMMPFIAGATFEDCKLPTYLQPYWPLIQACLRPEIGRGQWACWPKRTVKSDLGKVYYLTIEESFVEAGNSQRRPGLHVDSPGDVKVRRGKGAGHTYYGHDWGRGCAHVTGVDPRVSTILYGGIYLASNLAHSCRVWDCGVSPSVVGRLGDIERLRAGLSGPGQDLLPNTLYWITDRTPHESLPVTESGVRQFFRLVTSEVSLWYRDHSTPNPLVQPDPDITKVVVGNKFSEEGLQVLE